MANKIVITIEDNDDSVQVVSDPSFAEIMKAIATSDGPTPAQCYAIGALNKILELNKEAEAKRAVVDVPALMAVPDDSVQD